RRRDLRHNRWRRQQRPRHRIQIEQGRECLSRPLQLQWRRRRWALWAIGGRARRRALRHDIKTRRKRCGRGVQVEQGREQLSRSAQLQWQRRRVAYGGLVEGRDGVLYGTTSGGRSAGSGSVFKLNKN